MKIALPLHRGVISAHFSKAQQFMIYDTQLGELRRFINPAVRTSGCRGKAELLTQLAASGIDGVVVRHIGERMFIKLRQRNLAVWHCHRKTAPKELNLAELTTLNSEETRQSRRQQACRMGVSPNRLQPLSSQVELTQINGGKRIND